MATHALGSDCGGVECNVTYLRCASFHAPYGPVRLIYEKKTASSQILIQCLIIRCALWSRKYGTSFSKHSFEAFEAWSFSRGTVLYDLLTSVKQLSMYLLCSRDISKCLGNCEFSLRCYHKHKCPTVHPLEVLVLPFRIALAGNIFHIAVFLFKEKAMQKCFLYQFLKNKPTTSTGNS